MTAIVTVPVPKKCLKCRSEIPFKRYCRQHHQKWQTISDEYWRFHDAGDQFGMELCSMFLNNQKASNVNLLKPTRAMNNRPPIKATKLSDFVKEMASRYLHVMEAMAEVLVSGEIGPHISDIWNRAKKVASELIRGNYKALRLMDGHGRMIFNILFALVQMGHDKFVDNLTIELVDLDPVVNAYHRSVFVGKACKNIRVVHGDVCDQPMDRTTYVYLNFCGMAPSFEKVKAFARQYALQDLPFMISYYDSRRAKIKDYINSLRQLPEIRSHGRFENVSCPKMRESFKTFVFVPRVEYITLPKTVATPPIAIPGSHKSSENLVTFFKTHWQGSKKQFCSQYGVSTSNLYRWLRGESSPKCQSLVAEWKRTLHDRWVPTFGTLG